MFNLSTLCRRRAERSRDDSTNEALLSKQSRAECLRSKVLMHTLSRAPPWPAVWLVKIHETKGPSGHSHRQVREQRIGLQGRLTFQFSRQHRGSVKSSECNDRTVCEPASVSGGWQEIQQRSCKARRRLSVSLECKRSQREEFWSTKLYTLWVVVGAVITVALRNGETFNHWWLIFSV